MNQEFDAIVIGAGQAGPSLAARFAQRGQRVALIERKHLGGTCVNDGCIPTKTLVASARAAHVARTAARYGVSIGGEVAVDMRAVKARKDAVVAESITGLTTWLGGLPTLQVIRGEARFTGPNTVRVGADDLSAPKIFVNTGGRPSVPDWPGLRDVPYLTNTSMMAIDFLPDHLVIVGGSYIGLEFAQMYRRFGSRVTVIEAGPRLIGREDAEVSAAVRALLEGEGIDVHVGAANLSMARQGSGVRVAFDAAASAQAIDGSHLLLAVGRVPNTADLGLAAAGIATDARGFITVDDELRTSAPGVWALGDVNGKGAFTHTSYNDHEIVAANLLDGGTRRVSDRISAYALYTDPPLGRIGMSEAEVRQSGRAAKVATFPMARVGRARERGETTGFMKVLVDAQTERILGAALFGIEADEVVQLLLLAMAADLPYTRITQTMFIHPTVSELLPSLFAALEPLT
ncbi:FAD-containing oxidoreductase [Rhizobacter sp. Root404]|uniref:FAD-containing oxidoreductase n=1 Tax=Rhizobacter sp. Root404 TaxID=1736528 RepID=UPI0006F49284|nr:FAD-containing oxidoreductase [Rhizobacter sp. Root404]KQW36390.1 mercuric reductase [Rhizobacter sp. Root404]